MKKRFSTIILMISAIPLLLTGCKDTKTKDIVVKNETEIIAEDITNNTSEDEEFVSPTPAGDNSELRVVCFGDSLTVGTGGEGVTMPDTIAKLSGATVLNYGGYGESSSCISARQGGNPQYLVEEIVIPADCSPVKAQCDGKYGYEMLLVFGDAGINNVTLAGIEGTYALVDDMRCFTRLTPGDEITVPSGTQLFTHAMLDKKDDDILVIWAGSNDGIEVKEDIPSFVNRIDEMIAFQGNDKFVVVSLTSRHARIPLVDDMNSALSEHFGEHYLDLRSYMVDKALDQLNITPTDMDKEAIERRDIPYSLRYSLEEDENHGNSYFYEIAGQQIYKKLQELGYLY